MFSPSERDLDAWMSRAANGDRTVLHSLFAALHARALRLARRRLPEDQAMDAAQAIVTKVFARAADFEAGRAALPWFYAIASGELRTITRRRKVARTRSGDADAADVIATAFTPEDEMLDAEVRATLDRAVARLDGSSAAAIAELLGEPTPNVPRATFRKRLSRAIAKLRIMMREADAD